MTLALQQATGILAKTRTNFVVYASKSTSGNHLELDGRTHGYSLSFSQIEYASREILLYQVGETIYLSLSVTYLSQRVLVDITSQYEYLKNSLDIQRLVPTEVILNDFNRFELSELLIEPEIKSHLLLDGEILVFNLTPEESLEDEDNPVHEVIEQLITVADIGGAVRHFHLQYENAEFSGGGYTYEIEDEQLLEDLLQKKLDLALQTSGTFIQKQTVAYTVSTIKSEHAFLLLIDNKSYLNQTDCEYEMQRTENNKFKQYQLM